MVLDRLKRLEFSQHVLTELCAASEYLRCRGSAASIQSTSFFGFGDEGEDDGEGTEVEVQDTINPGRGHALLTTTLGRRVRSVSQSDSERALEGNHQGG